MNHPTLLEIARVFALFLKILYLQYSTVHLRPRDAGQLWLGQVGCRTRRMQDSRDEGKEGWRKVGMRERRDVGKEGCRKGVIEIRRNFEMGRWNKGRKRDTGKEGFRTKEIQDLRDTGREGSGSEFLAYICVSYPKMRQIFNQIKKFMTRTL